MKSEEEEKADESPELSSLLKRLPHETAPWYFEAKLKQRLAEGGTARRPFLLRPAFMLPLAGAAAAVVMFLALPRSAEEVPDFPPPDPVEQGRPVKPSKQTQRRPTVPPNEFFKADTSPQRGPSADQNDPFLPTTITLPEQNDQGASVVIPQLSVDSSDTVATLVVTADSADSISNHPPDSLRRDR
jgi:hypothetical protein